MYCLACGRDAAMREVSATAVMSSHGVINDTEACLHVRVLT